MDTITLTAIDANKCSRLVQALKDQLDVLETNPNARFALFDAQELAAKLLKELK